MMHASPPTEESRIAQESERETSPAWRPHQLQLLEWFSSEAPSLAAPYEAAVKLMNDVEFPARVHLICHIVRDIYSRLPEVLDGSHRRVEATAVNEAIDKLAVSWGQYSGESFTEHNSDSPGPESTTHVRVSVLAARKVQELFLLRRSIKKQPKSAEVLALALYKRFVESGRAPHTRLIKTFENERRWFTGRAHLVRDNEKIPSVDGLEEHFSTFERTLHSLVAPHFTVQQELSDILQQANQCNENVKEVVARLSAPQHERYFLDRLRNPDWIMPLNQLGMFREPPGLIQVEDGGLKSPIWPQSRYLARMAKIAPEDVARVLANIHTENWHVKGDIVTAAKAMPANIAKRLVGVIGTAWQHQVFSHLIYEVGELVAALASGGQPEAALQLTKLVFAFKDAEADDHSLDFDNCFYYDSMVDNVVPSLVVACPREFLPLLLDWMEQVLKGPKNDLELDRTSIIWRPAIEEHDQNHDYEFAVKMVDIVRGACELGIRSDVVSLNHVLTMIQSRSGQVLSRLRVHLIAEFAESNKSLAVGTVMDPEQLKTIWIKHEYARLVGMRWLLLNDSERDLWLSWIDAGPEGSREDHSDHPDDLSHTNSKRADWKFQRLHWIKDHLTGEHRRFYDQMLGKYGVPRLADLNVHFSGEQRLERHSPMSADTLAAMGFRHAVEVITKWRPDPTSQSRDESDLLGLVREFKNLVERDPLAASKEAAVMEENRPIFARTFLEAMHKAIKDGKEIDLVLVIGLAKWIVGRPADERDLTFDTYELIDCDWQLCRDTLASLIGEVAKARDRDGSVQFGLIHRNALWEVVRDLSSYPPTEYIMRDASEDPREADWPTVMLNSTRAKALRAVLAYADWVASSLIEIEHSRASSQDGFNSMPEVREILDGELDRPDPDCASYTAFGSCLESLLRIDATWLRANVGRIFDLRATEAMPTNAHCWAAWSVFLYTHRPHIQLYDLLRDQFSSAVDQSMLVSDCKKQRKVWSLLSQHLVLLFARGDLGLTGDAGLAADSGIIRRLVTKSHISVRSYAVQYAGEALCRQQKPVPLEVISRLESLWDHYWNEIGRNDALATAQSAVFGSWFSSGVFEPQWSIVRLLDFVSAAPRAEPGKMIVEKLASICRNDPLNSAQIIQKLVLGSTEGWQIQAWKTHAKQVLEVALETGDEAQLVAEDVIDWLGRRGFEEFGELL